MPVRTDVDRICTRCKGVIPAGRKSYYCRPCTAEIGREYRSRPGVRKRQVENSRRWAYGIEPEDYALMLAEQGGVCFICSQPETVTRDGVVRSLCVDHDHKTGKVRRLLCVRCNTAVGFLGDDPLLAEAIAEYLRENI